MDISMERIPLILRRYPFEEKMDICQKVSQDIVGKTDLSYIAYGKKLAPWEIEIICELSIISDNEIECCTVYDRDGDRMFTRITNYLRNYQHPHFEKGFDSSAFFMITMQNQLLHQRDVKLRLFRYNYILNYKDDILDMEVETRKVYGVSYSNILEAIWVIYSIFLKNDYTKNQLSASLLNYAFNKYYSILEKFSLTREKHIILQNTFFSEGTNSYYYGFKSIYPFPIIIKNETMFLPIPYLLIDAATESVLNTLTRDNDSLRSKIGKNAVEKYVYYLLSSSNCYDEVSAEVEYNISRKKSNIFSPDVMTLKDDVCILFDCKSSVPSLKLRDFDKSKINETISRSAENIIQLYNRCEDLLSGYYYPFKKKVLIKKENLFGIIIVLEDSYIARKDIYCKTAESLSIAIDSKEMDYIRAHIKIVEMSEVEQVSFCGKNYGDYLIKQASNSSVWNNYTFFDNDGNNIAIPALREFYDTLKSIFIKFMKEYITFQENFNKKVL